MTRSPCQCTDVRKTPDYRPGSPQSRRGASDFGRHSLAAMIAPILAADSPRSIQHMPNRALLSVYDKSGIAELGRGLVDLGYEIVSTGGTLAALEAAGVPVTAVSDVTAFPEILDGRVKTLHPHIHGGLLARRDDPAHMSALEAHQISPIDVVAANLYPFAETIARPGVSLTDALEQIDIGGPAMIRAAAKNFPGVIVLTDPADYSSALDDLRDGRLSPERRRALAAKAFAHTAAYDS